MYICIDICTYVNAHADRYVYDYIILYLYIYDYKCNCICIYDLNIYIHLYDKDSDEEAMVIVVKSNPPHVVGMPWEILGSWGAKPHQRFSI